MDLHNVSIVNNSADALNNGSNAGGIAIQSGSTVTMQNSVLANNSDLGTSGDTPDCFGSIVSAGYNHIESVAGCTITGDSTGNVTGSDPALGGLLNNGGNTLTRLPNAGSPLINSGNPAGCLDPQGATLIRDQRGFIRPAGGRCDKGAVESGSVPIPTPTATATPTRTLTPTPTRTPTLTPTPTSTPLAAFTYLINTHDDELAVNALCSLREAVLSVSSGSDVGGCGYANANLYAIVLESGDYPLTLPPNATPGAGGALNVKSQPRLNGITHTLSISGVAGTQTRIVQTQSGQRVIALEQGSLQLQRLAVQGGTIQGDGGGVYVAFVAALQLDHAVVFSNTAENGGGLYVAGLAQLNNSRIYGNSAQETGGGLHACRLLSMRSSVVDHNTAEQAGGILLCGNSQIENSTIYSNSATAGAGGGVLVERIQSSQLGLNNVTIAGNRAFTGSGGLDFASASLPSGEILNTLIAGNTGSEGVPADCAAALATPVPFAVRTMIGADGCGQTHAVDGNLIGSAAAPIDAHTGAFEAVNGAGPTLRLRADSPAVDAGDTCSGIDSEPLPTDQVGQPRVSGARCDMGAFELQPVTRVFQYLPAVTR